MLWFRFYEFVSKFVRFEDEDDEGSYQMLRKRERAKVYLHDYTDEYCSKTEYGSLVLQQRSYMIHWIVEVSLFCIQRFETLKFSP